MDWIDTMKANVVSLGCLVFTIFFQEISCYPGLLNLNIGGKGHENQGNGRKKGGGGGEKKLVDSSESNTEIKDCPGKGIFSHPSSCSKYLECESSHDKPEVRKCSSESLRFDPVEEKCVKESNAMDCHYCKGKSHDGKRLPNPRSKNSYYECEDKLLRFHKCEKMAEYDEKEKKCRIIEKKKQGEVEEEVITEKSKKSSPPERESEGEVIEEVVVEEEEDNQK